jgi:LysM repeat protein
MLVPTPVFSKYFLLNRVTFKTSEVHGLKKCDATNHSQYTAHYGDTLTSIAMRFKMRVDYLMDLNPLIKAVRPGMTINIC